MIRELASLTRTETVGFKNGFYFVNGRDNLYGERIEKDKLANLKWKKFLRKIKYLQAAPYLRTVFASGSLAANNPEPKSDFDVLILIKSGRLYTGRFFLWIISSILGSRRGRFDLIAPDKLCFNHYLADNNLELSHKSLYVAQSVINLRPVIFSDKILESFSTANGWVSGYCYNFKQVGKYRTARPVKTLILLAKCGEFILNNKFGDVVEKLLKAVQQGRIKKNPATYESGGRIIFTDKELEFHPRSFERSVINNYNIAIKKMSIFGVMEEDSGLSK
ncbi:MAG: hypothetical protein HYZ69_04355 [Candidatus Colwellbacteria bacterium]|nr:hypothetical protein [Candidatus Colwellbacteria bacterium]